LLADFSSGVCVEYLPPYSSDFWPIKEAFSKIKAFLCQHHTYYSQTMGDGILFDMYEITDIITVKDAAGYFMLSGYFRTTIHCCMYISECQATGAYKTCRITNEIIVCWKQVQFEVQVSK
jgi:hypothetical protein